MRKIIEYIKNFFRSEKNLNTSRQLIYNQIRPIQPIKGNCARLSNMNLFTIDIKTFIEENNEKNI